MAKVVPLFNDPKGIDRDALTRSLEHTAARMHERAKRALCEAELTGKRDVIIAAQARLQLTKTLLELETSDR